MSYTLTQKEYSTLKARLTRAINSHQPEKVKAEVLRANTIFDAKGWPDDWARWQRALDDAEWAAYR